MRYIQNFKIYSNGIEIYLTDGGVMQLFFNEFSGKAYYRNKIGGKTIKHPGIYIGIDANGVQYFAHNHIENGKPALVPMDQFTKGMPLFEYDVPATLNFTEIITRAMNGILKAEKYHAVIFNCQDYVNQSITNKRKSPAVDNTFAGIAFFGLLAIIGAATSNE